MFDNRCPICRGQKIVNNQCARCSADLTQIRHIEGHIAALYSSVFLAVKQEKYKVAMHLILELKKLRNDLFTQTMENFLFYMAMQ